MRGNTRRSDVTPSERRRGAGRGGHRRVIDTTAPYGVEDSGFDARGRERN